MADKEIWKDMKIYIACLKNLVTGGIELLHQLCHELNSYEGIDAYIWFEDEKDAIIPEPYRHYGNIVAISENPDKNTVLIFPEVWVNKANQPKYSEHKKVIYFMSVDYYVANIPRSQYLVFPENTIFMVQSWYAYTWLKDKTGIDAIMVTDYLNDEFMNADLSKPRKRQILYNPKKGLDVTKKIMAELPNEKFIPIENMTPREIRNLMEESMLYIDFGNHPWKDRIPREAAMCGCCVIANREGSADNCMDVPIPSDYKIFHNSFIMPAVKQILFVLEHYEGCKYDFDDYRTIIKNEKAWFRKGVKKMIEELG